MDPQATTQRPRLVRRYDDRMIAGVAAGLARYLNVETIWIRLAFIGSLFLGGAGVLAYLILMLAMPRQDAEGAEVVEGPARRLGDSLSDPKIIGAGLLVVGSCLLLINTLRISGGVVWGLALVGLGIALFVRADRAPAADGPPPLGPPPPVAPPPGPTPPGPTRPGPTPPGPTSPATPPLPAPGDTPAPSRVVAPPPLPPPPRRPRRERSGLGAMTVGALLIAVGALATLDVAGRIRPSVTQYLALSLSIVGVGVLVGAWRGRARWLIVPGILLAAVTLVSMTATVPFTGGIGSTRVTATEATDLQPEYNKVAGEIVLDLRGVATLPERIGVKATVAAGQVRVIVPDDATVNVVAQVGAGEIDMFGQRSEGSDLYVDVLSVGDEPVIGAYTLDLQVWLGFIQVERREVTR